MFFPLYWELKLLPLIDVFSTFQFEFAIRLDLFSEEDILETLYQNQF